MENEETVYTIIPPVEIDEATKYRRPQGGSAHGGGDRGLGAEGDFNFGDAIPPCPSAD